MLRKIIRVLILVNLLAILIVGGWLVYKHFIDQSPSNEVSTYEARTDLDNTVPTDPEVDQHIVDPDKPRYMSIAKIGVDRARVVEVGVTGADNRLDDPKNVFDVGWYRYSTKPGELNPESSAGLYDGHNTGAYERGVFWHLNQLTVGDQIIIERGDGAILTYEVREAMSVKVDEVNMTTMTKSAIDNVEGLNIISCNGDWDEMAGSYTHRMLIRAVLVSSDSSAG